MNKEDYYGKYILREGDLRPELIDKASYVKYGLSFEVLAYYQSIGLLFDNREEALEHWKCIMGAMKKPINKRDIIKERVYISGPISGHDINMVRVDFQRVEYELIAQGYEPVNPVAEADKHPEHKTTHDHMRHDIELLMTCDYIYLMHHWTHSKGCQVEFEVATSIGLPVMFEESGELTKFE